MDESNQYVPQPDAGAHSSPDADVPLTNRSEVPSPGSPRTRGWISERYSRVRPIGHGGMGAVTLVYDFRLRRRVAFKELRADVDSPSNRARFLREALVSSQLDHPGVVPVYDVGNLDDGRPFYTMRFVAGRSLAVALRESETASRLPRLLSRFHAVCVTVAHAHARGVIHRDLTPSNVLLGRPGETVVLDWGLCKVIDAPELPPEERSEVLGEYAADRLSEHRGVLGTRGFASPEQVRGERVDRRADVFSLGVILYLLLTGAMPYEPSEGDWSYRDSRPCRAPHLSNPAVPGGLSELCASALELRAECRLPSASRLSDYLGGLFDRCVGRILDRDG